MFSLNFYKILPWTIAAAVAFVAAPHELAAASPAKSALVTFTASGTFASTPVSGADTLLLRGQPFTISVTGSSSLTPSQHGRNWALFMPLSATGNVYSGLLPGQPIPISATTAAIQQAVGASNDIFQAGFPVNVLGIALTARAYITLPGGTLSTPLLRPFSSVALDPTIATMSYSNTTATTVLAVQTGTLVATIPPPPPSAALMLPFGVGQLHSIRPLFGNPADFLSMDTLSALEAGMQAETTSPRIVLALDNQAAKGTRIQLQ